MWQLFLDLLNALKEHGVALLEKLNNLLSSLFSWLGDAFIWLLHSFRTLFEWVMDALVYVLKTVFYLILDGLLISIKAFIAGLDFSAVSLQWAAGKGLIPAQAAYFMCAIGFPQMVTMIAAAYAIRLLLNLIPSWATRA